jgi:hypothetical protein
MELEQRVKTLEYEMRIIKNEIQQTLNEVQEQISAQYKANAAQAAANKLAESQTPALKKASLADIQAAQNEILAEEEREHLRHLEAWAFGNIERLGSGRVGRLVTLFTERGYLREVEQKLLIALIASQGDNGPSKAPLTQVLDAVLKLDGLVKRAEDGDEALQIIEEANLG